MKVDKKYYLMRSGKILEDTYKIESIKDVLTCPHCKKLIGITPQEQEVKVIEQSEEIPLYTGDCVDCKFLCMLTKEMIIELEGEEKLIARCEIQGNVNPIFFTKKDLEDRHNFQAEGFGINVKNPDACPHYPSEYLYRCYAFKKRDKKINIDKL